MQVKLSTSSSLLFISLYETMNACCINVRDSKNDALQPGKRHVGFDRRGVQFPLMIVSHVSYFLFLSI